jgi:diguanylate cyclase (GGDEF)-like protein/PAS domain S-box-containing protein
MMKDRLERISDCLASLGPDPDSNIARLTALAGELLSADCALYNRLEDGYLCSAGQWQTPPGFEAKERPDGHICHDVISGNKDGVIFIGNLPETPYVDSDPNVRKYALQSYCGQAVRCEGEPVGSLCVMYQSDHHISDEDGRVLGIIASAIGGEDRRKQVQEDLRTSQRRLMIAMDLAHLVHWECDIEKAMFVFDDNFYALYGTTAEDEGGQYMSAQSYAERFLHPDDVHLVAEEIEKAIATTDPHYSAYVEHRIIRADGEVRFIAVRYRIVKDAAGRTVRTYGANQDITERKVVEEALRESEARYRSLFDDSPIALVEVDDSAAKAYIDRLRASGVEDLAKYADDHPEAVRECASLLVFTHANKAALDLYEAPDMEVFRENARHFVANAPASFLKGDFLAIAQGGHAEREQVRMTRSGRKIHIHSKWTVPSGYEKTVRRILSCDMDVTESREAEEALRESEEKFRALVEKAIVGVYLVQDGVFRYANSKCAEIHGYADPQEMEGLDIRATFFPEDLPPVEKTEEWVHGEGETQSRQFRIVRKNGEVRHVETFGRYTTYRGKEAVIGMVVDITDRKNAEEALHWKTTFLEALTESSQDGILVLDSRMKKVAQNQRLVEMWRIPADVAGAEDQEQCLNFLMASIKNPEEFYKKLTHLHDHPDDTVRGEFELNNGKFVEAFSYPVLGKDSVEQYGRIWTFRDITEIRRYWDMLENLSTTDGLTGISNRRRFDEFLQREWRRSMREYSTLSLLIVDIDYFKEFNDRYGHLAGDDCLKQVAVTLGGTMRRASDLVARYGGDEFACVLPGMGEKKAVKVAQRIVDEVARLTIPHESSSVAEHVTVSIGVATEVPAKGREYSDLMRRADRCLYAAKQQGRNRVVALHDDYRIEVKGDGQ